jgi:hypothetical protein
VVTGDYLKVNWDYLFLNGSSGYCLLALLMNGDNSNRVKNPEIEQGFFAVSPAAR